MTENQPETEHWPPERMINAGHVFSTFEDLEGLDYDTLAGIAAICEAPEIDDLGCVPCKAQALAQDMMNADEEELSVPSLTEEQAASLSEMEDVPVFAPGQGLVNDRPQHAQEARSANPLTEITRTVKYLNGILTELTQGPPIPPREVSLEELASLTVGAERWLAMIEAQGLELAPRQEAIRQEIERVIKKVKGHA